MGCWTQVLWLCLGLQFLALVKHLCRWLCHSVVSCLPTWYWCLLLSLPLHLVTNPLSSHLLPCPIAFPPSSSCLPTPSCAHSLLHNSPNLPSPSMHPWPISLLPWSTCPHVGHSNALLVLHTATCCLLLVVNLLVVSLVVNGLDMVGANGATIAAIFEI